MMNGFLSLSGQVVVWTHGGDLRSYYDGLWLCVLLLPY